MRTILIISLILFLAGCNTVKPVPLVPQVVMQTEYIVRIPPKELTTLPIPVANIDVDKSTQKDVAAWLILKQQYEDSLKNQLIDIGSFFVDQQTQLDNAAKVQNNQLEQAGIKAQQQEQVDANNKTVK
jgi:uncharacterized protein YcfL